MTWRLPPANGQENNCMRVHTSYFIKQKRDNKDGEDMRSYVAIPSGSTIVSERV